MERSGAALHRAAWVREKTTVSRRFVLFAGLSVLLPAGALCVVSCLARDTAVESSGPQAAPVNADAAAQRIDTRLSFCVIEGIVLLDGRPAAARVEVRLLRRGGVGYVPSEISGPEISLWPWESSVPTPGFDADEIPTLSRDRDPFAAPEAVAEAGADGRFRFERLAPGIWEVAAIDAQHRAVAITSEVAPKEPVDTVELALPFGAHALAGRIRFADGRPFRGPVRLVEERSGGAEVHRPTVRLDADGRFRFEHIGEQPVSLLAWMPHVLRVRTRDVLLPRAEPLEIVIGVAPETIEGRVIDEMTSEPVAGARVQADAGGGSLRSARVSVACDANGRFSISARCAHPVLRVCAHGYAARRHEPNVDGFTVRLQRLAVIEGLATDRAGEPLAGVDVVAAACSVSQEEFGTVQRTRTDAGGRYRFEGLAAGSYTVFVWSPGWVSPGLRDLSAGRFNPLEVSVEPGETAHNDLPAVPTVAMKGLAFDQHGRPIPAARILVEKYETHGAFRRYDEPLVTVADSRGCFSARVPPGPYDVTIQTPATDWRHFFLPAPTQGGVWRCADGTLAFEVPRSSPPDTTITVEVVDDRDRPVPGARVTWCRGKAWGLHVSARTAADGHCRLGPVRLGNDGDPGDLAVAAPGHLGRKCGGSSRGSGRSLLVRVALPRGRPIAGRVVWPDGKPAAGAAVSVEPVAPSSLITDTWDRTRSQRASDVDGRFRFLAPFGACRVSATSWRHGRRHEASAHDARGDPVTLVLAPCPAEVRKPEPGALVVRVLDPGGRPVEEAKVQQYVEGAPEPTCAREVWEGECRLDGWSWSDRGSLMITDAKDREGHRLRACLRQVAPGTTGGLEIRLADECVIEGVVVDADGRPVRGCVVAARYQGTVPPDWPRREHARARTDVGGRFRLGGLGPFAYSVAVIAWPPEHPAGPPVKVTAPARGVRVPLLRGKEVKLRFLLEDGRPVEGLTVRIDDGAGTGYPEVEGWTDASGLVIFRGLAPGRPHGLYVDGDAWGLEHLRGIYGREWIPEDTVFRLKYEQPITGVVRGADGKPTAGAIVWCKSGEEWRPFSADEEGRFTVPGVPRASTCLRAAARDASRDDWRVAAESEIEVAADTRHVELFLPPYRKVTVRTVPPPSPGDEREFTLHTRRPDGTWVVRRLAGRDGGTALMALSPARPGPHLLRVVSRGIRTTLAFEGDVDPTRDTLVAHLVPAVSLRIRVTLAGAAWMGRRAEVKLRRGPLVFDAEPVKGRQGEFRVADLVPGPCRVVVTVQNVIRIRHGLGHGTTGWESVEAEAVAGAVVTVPVTLFD